ncbi:MAG: hypothetical protein LC803_22975 [Acidobacteria bacterium]|nr:hypothetical protein [Acidobacteriota bacterium]
MSQEHSAETERLDEASATALITMEGLDLFCFTERGTYEGGFLNLPPRHVLTLTITGEEEPRPPIIVKGDIHIEVVNPVREGMYRYEKGDFNRQTGSNDPNDFRWIADVEGQEFHDVELHKRPGPGLRRLFIDSATIYTKEVRDEDFVIIRVDTTGVPCRFYGTHARLIGAALESGEGGGVRVRIEGPGGGEIWLPKRDGDPYVINFDNDCDDILPNSSHSDFLLYYEVLSDPQGIKFDLRLADLSGAPENQCTSETFAPKFVDGMGIACDNGYLRHTSSLPV